MTLDEEAAKAAWLAKQEARTWGRAKAPADSYSAESDPAATPEAALAMSAEEASRAAWLARQGVATPVVDAPAGVAPSVSAPVGPTETRSAELQSRYVAAEDALQELEKRVAEAEVAREAAAAAKSIAAAAAVTPPTTPPLVEMKNAVELTREQLKWTLENRNAITEEPGRRGRFSRAWETLEKDADWLGFIGERCFDALDDVLFRSNYLEAEEDTPGAEASRQRWDGDRERVVVLGSGWGAAAMLSQLKNADVDVTVISPRNYFLFTPMLAGAALGTLEPRSIIEPIREANPKSTYFEAEATSIDFVRRTVACESVVCEGMDGCEIRTFDVPYDLLLVAVGASTNTFGVKGVKEHCLFMKQLSDALRYRDQLSYAFEQACS